MPNGDIFTGKFDDFHKVEGKQVYSSDGAVYEGQWKKAGDSYGEDVWHGVGSLTHPDGKKSMPTRQQFPSCRNQCDTGVVLAGMRGSGIKVTRPAKEL